MSDAQALATIDDLLERLAAANTEIQMLRSAFLKIRASSWPNVKGGCWCRNPNTLNHTPGCTVLRVAFDELTDEEW